MKEQRRQKGQPLKEGEAKKGTWEEQPSQLLMGYNWLLATSGEDASLIGIGSKRNVGTELERGSIDHLEELYFKGGGAEKWGDILRAGGVKRIFKLFHPQIFSISKRYDFFF